MTGQPGRPRAGLGGALSRVLAPAANRLLAVLRLFVIYRTGTAIGDVVCMTAVIRDYHARTGSRFLVLTRRPEIFRGNPKVAAHFDVSRLGDRGLRTLGSLLRLVRGSRVLPFGHPLAPGASFEQDMRGAHGDRHLIRIHAAGFPLPLADPLRPEIVLEPAEARRYEEALRLPPRFALIQSAGKGSFTPNKEWGSGRFQAVVDALPGTVFVQIGSPDDPPLAGVIDFRGRTASLRELAYVVSRAAFVVCLEGLYNHLAAAFAVPAFLIQGGFTHAGLAAYPTTVAISRSPQIACAPCWLTAPCPIPGRPCTSDIPPERVVAEILRAFPGEAGGPGAGRGPEGGP